MNKLLLILLATSFLTACEDKKLYEQAVLEQMEKEQDIKDYKIDPTYIAKCVVDTSSPNMPGAFGLDPKRMLAYRNYAKMLNLHKSADPKKTLEELRKDFGDAKGLSEARANYDESFLNCYTAVISETEVPKKESAPAKP